MWSKRTSCHLYSLIRCLRDGRKRRTRMGDQWVVGCASWLGHEWAQMWGTFMGPILTGFSRSLYDMHLDPCDISRVRFSKSLHYAHILEQDFLKSLRFGGSASAHLILYTSPRITSSSNTLPFFKFFQIPLHVAVSCSLFPFRISTGVAFFRTRAPPSANLFTSCFG